MRAYGPVRQGAGAIPWLLALVAFLAGPHLGPALASTFPNSPSTAARPSPSRGDDRAARAVTFAVAQVGKPYRWGDEGPDAFDCSGLTWAAYRAAGVEIPRTARAQLEGLPRATGPLRPGDLIVYATNGPSRRHVAMVVASRRMVEARGRGIPVRVTRLRPGWLGVVRP